MFIFYDRLVKSAALRKHPPYAAHTPTGTLNEHMRDFFKHAALALTTSSTLFLWTPLYLAYLSRDDLNFNLLDSLVVYGTFTVAAGIIFYIIAQLLKAVRLSSVASASLYFLLFWALISGFMLPLVEQGGMVSAEDLKTNSSNVVLVFVFSSILTALAFTRLKQATHAFVFVLILTSIGPIAPEIFKALASAERFSTLSDTDNVIVLSLDGISGPIAKKVLDENPDLKLAFNDFTFYDNAISLAPATAASLRTELYGNINYRALAQTSTNLAKKLVDTPNSIKREQSASADIMTYGAYGIFNTESKDRVTSDDIANSSIQDKIAVILNFYPYVGARIGTAETAKLISLKMRPFLSKYLVSRQSERALIHQGDSWDIENTFNNEILVGLTESLQVKNKPRSVRYMHFLHTHFPVDLDRECNYRSYDRDWFDHNQNYQGLYGETYCGLKQTADLLQKLKALDIYDKTLFIVKSDHGAPALYFDDAPQNYSINDHIEWGYDRYRPLLMIKNYSTRHQGLSEYSELVSLGDLARTLCLHSPSNQRCDVFKGLDLLNPQIADSSPRLYLDFVKNAASTYNFGSQMTAEISRDKDFQRALVNSGKVKLSNAPLKLYAQRIADLNDIKVALEKYHQANGSYPISQGLDGFRSDWGRSAQDWIPGLAPAFIASLPRDPALSEQSVPQYLYQSNGVDFKLILHGDTVAASIAQIRNRYMLDPLRSSYSFGYWTTGGRNW